MSLDQPAGFVKQQTVTRDAFLGGRLLVSQPRHGFRAGLDSVLLGAAVASDSGTLVDLGAGVGTAALVALAHNSGLSAVLAERDAAMLALAQENILENGFAGRATVFPVDLGKPAGLFQAGHANTADSVIANPPFFGADSGTLSRQSGRAAARHMPASTLDAWVRTAAGATRSGGEAIFVYRAQDLPALLLALDGRFGAITVLPIVPRPGDDATRVLVRGRRDSRSPLVLKSPLVLHGPSGNAFSPAVDGILRGEGTLHW